MAACISPLPSPIGAVLYNNPAPRLGRASISGPGPRQTKVNVNVNMRPGRSSVPAKYVPKLSSSSSSSFSSESDSDSVNSADFSPSPTDLSSKRKSVLSMFQQPSSSSSTQAHRRGSVAEKLAQQKEPSLETTYGRCTSPLGAGSQANVMLCDSVAMGRMFAVKRFRKLKPQESEREYNKRLFGEYCISSTMRHENIVETLDLIRDEDNRLCLVMELCAGGDLFSYIKSAGYRSPNLPEIHCYFKQLINGLSYLHFMGVAHRDIKPENLLLNSDGTVLKISDFGVAEVFKTVTDRQAHKCIGLCGSEPYIAPEQFDGVKAEYDAAKVDLWSAGIVLYALLNGSMPWRRASRGDTDYDYYLESMSKVPKGSHHGFHAFDRLEEGPRDILYTLLQPDARLRASAKETQKHKWTVSIPCCRVDVPSPHHTHFVMARHPNTH